MRDPANENWLNRAVKLYQAGKLAQAEKLARQNLTRQPVAAANLLAGIATQRGDFPAAQKYLERALKAEPAALAIRMNLVNIARRAGDGATALKHLEIVAAGARNSAAAQYDLGCTYLDFDRPEDAIAAFRRSIAIKPDAKAKARLAEAHFNVGDVASAAPFAMSAIGSGHETALLHYILGRNFLDSKKPKLALESFDKALELDAAHHLSLVGRAVALGQTKDVVAARQATRSLLDLRPSIFVGASDAALRVVVPQPLNGGRLTGVKTGSDVYRVGNFPSQLRVDGMRIEYLLVDLARVDQEFGDVGADIVLNNIVNGDMLREGNVLDAARRACAAFGAPVVNAPDAAVLTTREGNYDRLRDSDLYVFPAIRTYETVGVDRKALAERIVEEVGTPVITRPSHTQFGGGAELCRTPDELRARLATWSFSDVCAIRYYECRDVLGNARQFRMASVGGELLPDRVNFAPYWHSHGPERGELNWVENGFEAEELAYLADPAAVIGAEPGEVFAPFVEKLGLEIFGIDFGLDEHGRVIIFEANASMNLFNPKLQYISPYRVEIRERFQDKVRDYLTRRAGV